jgi:hypothetical protein
MAVGDVEVDGLGRDARHQWFGADRADDASAVAGYLRSL